MNRSVQDLKLLVVEDTDAVARVVLEVLTREGYAVSRAKTCGEARSMIQELRPDALVLDVMLPDGTGLELLAEMRAAGVSTPVLMLTSLSDLDDVIRGLDAGADDYITKPFEVSVLAARVRALVRRTLQQREKIRIREVEMDRLARTVTADGTRVRLTPKEYALLEHVFLNPGRLITRVELLERVWNLRFDPGSNVVDTHLARLRGKLQRAGAGDLILTVRGGGFQLAADPSTDLPQEDTG